MTTSTTTNLPHKLRALFQEYGKAIRDREQAMQGCVRVHPWDRDKIHPDHEYWDCPDYQAADTAVGNICVDFGSTLAEFSDGIGFCSCPYDFETATVDHRFDCPNLEETLPTCAMCWIRFEADSCTGDCVEAS